jgi:transposase
MTKPRTTEPMRTQGVIRFEMPDDELAHDHPARVLWLALGKLDLSAFLAGARSVHGSAGRPTHSPRMLLTLWTYAISRGVGSARAIERLVETDRAYGWIVGDAHVSHHVLSRFRVGHHAALDKLMTDILGALMHKGLLSLELVAIDGMRVRAAASAPSFRRAESLEACREQAALHLKAVLAQADDPELSAAQKAAREAGARDFARRIEEAVLVVEELAASPTRRGEPRASTTDAQARVMKMADGGFRPAMNVQTATAGHPEGGPRTIVAIEVTNVGSDMSAVTPMLAQIEARTEQLPTYLLADGNHQSHQGIIDAMCRGVVPLVPVKTNSSAKLRDSAIEIWKENMATARAKELYRARSSLCELTNALMRARGLNQFLVRGLHKAGCVALLVAIASNLVTHLTALAT